MSNKAALLQSEKGEWTVGEVDIPTLGEGEVLVKVHACAIQPADSKVAKQAIFKMEYPTTLGSPVGGTVEALGEGTTNKVSIGDRIVCSTKIFSQKKAKYGGLQQYTVVDESEVIEIGNIDFRLAVTLGSNTPPAALFGPKALNMRRPTIPASPLPDSEAAKKIVIWGGSSAMGSLSISHAKQAGYTVISTSSPHNFDLLKSLGADYVYDHSDPDTIPKIRDLFPIDYWFDTISLPSTLSTIFKILTPEDQPVTKAHILLLLPPSYPGMPTPPEGITLQFHLFSTKAPENAEWQKWALSRGGYLEQAIKSGALKGVPADVIGGLEKVSDGIDAVHAGVSGKKVVIEPWA
ncbi:chaperonin 10-like protein [Dendryphion nanum]|uniref:Chaperonin 10-like protein n=1 Tax=Dendryphion nanum TaxID=256645 RepID=A0A9P9E025_9PLEO|nr:chaperonin 10-like protein [Dendryphion nanum]